jgi:hypothetical protein
MVSTSNRASSIAGSLSEYQCCNRWIRSIVASGYGGQPPSQQKHPEHKPVAHADPGGMTLQKAEQLADRQPGAKGGRGDAHQQVMTAPLLPRRFGAGALDALHPEECATAGHWSGSQIDDQARLLWAARFGYQPVRPLDAAIVRPQPACGLAAVFTGLSLRLLDFDLKPWLRQREHDPDVLRSGLGLAHGPARKGGRHTQRPLGH